MFIPIEFQKAFQKTQQDAIFIKASYQENPAQLQSRFGGTPYWENGTAIPVDKNNQPLVLLAQLNFAELPDNEQLPNQGILQFFIPVNDDFYGADLDNIGSQGQMITQFWDAPNASKSIAWPNAEPNEDDLVPVFGAHVLTFSVKPDSAGIDTIECANAMNANPFEVLEDVALDEKEEILFYDAMTEFTHSFGHKLLGYPHFNQNEPRENTDYRLLLQIDTDMSEDNDITWGDNGVGHIFIREDDLQAQNFDKVWFYWDCH